MAARRQRAKDGAGKSGTSAAAAPKSWRKLSRPARFAHLHVRLLVAIAFGVAVVPFSSGAWVTRLLIGWDSAMALYLAATIVMMARSDVGRIRQRAEAQDEGAVVLLAATGLAAAASLLAIFAELAGAKENPASYGLHIGLAVATILLSWFFIHTIFALHYAYEFYRDEGRVGGLEFPGKGAPDYVDFMYFSLVLAMTSQTSDVAISSRQIRGTVMAHSVFSFFFNTTIIALTVNIAGGVF